MSDGVKFSQFKKVAPAADKKIEMVGLRDGENIRADLTTDLVSTNSSVVFRDSKGRFKSASDVPELNNQLEVNRFLWDEIEKLNQTPEVPELPEDRLPIFAEDEPTKYPHAEDDEPDDLEVGDQWYQVTDPDFDYDSPDPEGLDLHIWKEIGSGNFEWVLVEPPAEYVDKSGDKMTGNLEMVKKDGVDPKIETRYLSSGENSNLHLQHDGNTRIYVGGNEVSFAKPIQLNQEGVDPDHAVTKKYVDDAIIELEEEIDALAPSVERGIWKFSLSGAVASKGQITMYDGMNQSGSPIGLFKSAKSIWLNELDIDGTPHGFANVKEGDLIELFVHGEADYGLFTVVAIHDESDGDIKYWVIDVEFVRALNPESKADNADSLRVKVIQPPSAEGESSDRYLLNGDVTTLNSTTTILAHSNGKWMNIKAAANNSSGFFVFQDYNGQNLLQVRGDGEIQLKPGRMATGIDEITTKRYVDTQIDDHRHDGMPWNTKTGLPEWQQPVWARKSFGQNAFIPYTYGAPTHDVLGFGNLVKNTSRLTFPYPYVNKNDFSGLGTIVFSQSHDDVYYKQMAIFQIVYVSSSSSRGDTEVRVVCLWNRYWDTMKWVEGTMSTNDTQMSSTRLTWGYMMVTGGGYWGPRK